MNPCMVVDHKQITNTEFGRFVPASQIFPGPHSQPVLVLSSSTEDTVEQGQDEVIISSGRLIAFDGAFLTKKPSSHHRSTGISFNF